jgi:hypothetical protein
MDKAESTSVFISVEHQTLEMKAEARHANAEPRFLSSSVDVRDFWK